MRNPVRTGTMIALAAASLFTAACSKKDESSSNKPTTTETKPATPAMGDEKTAKIHCEGINECKGHGSCKSAQNDCAGKNGCKGKSFAYTATEDECKTKGGTVVANKM